MKQELWGVLNPHEPGKDRIRIAVYGTGQREECKYCDCPTNEDVRRYDGEKHAADCPIRSYVDELQAKATGQMQLQVLEEAA